MIQNILRLAVESYSYIQLLCLMNYVEWIVLRHMEVRLIYTDFPFVTSFYWCRNRETLKRCVLCTCIIFYGVKKAMKNKRRKRNWRSTQTHRMAEAGRDLWSLSGPMPSSGRATYSRLPRKDHAQAAFEGLHKLAGHEWMKAACKLVEKVAMCFWCKLHSG